MTTNTTRTGPSEKLISDLLDSLDKLFGLHPGFRPVHAKGVICSGTFTPSAEAASLTRAPHANRQSVPVVVRFSNFTGIPTIADNDPNASPRGFAVRFNLADHVHTDIIGHSENGFPVRNGEDFLEFALALAESGPDAAKPTRFDKFLEKHPETAHFVSQPKFVPVSYATESYFAVTAFQFTNKDGATRYGRFQIRPENGNEYLSDEAAKNSSGDFLIPELGERLKKGPIKIKITVQLAEDGDNINDSSVTWPDSRKQVDFGTITVTALVDEADPEMRKIIFDPIPRVDGIAPSEDPLIEIRSELYILSGRRRRAATGVSSHKA